MNTKKIGLFLKELRKEKELTQEHLAEIFGVSGRTVSRWESGSNMPDLSILIQIADYYEIEIKEILDGERTSENMDKKIKETLTKVASYSDFQKEKAEKTGNAVFGVMFAACVVSIVIQMIVATNLQFILGETVILLLGGIMYITIMVRNGMWDTGSRFESTPCSDIIISTICAGVFSFIFAMCLLQRGAPQAKVINFSLGFFAGVLVLGFIALRLIALCNKKRRNSLEQQLSHKANVKTNDQVNVKICNVKDVVEAGVLINILKENGISAYSQDSSSGVALHAASGFGLYGVDIFTSKTDAERASKLLEEYTKSFH